LITKPKIGAWGLNWQHCNKITFFPAYSYEQYYQAVRRCWRFGQKKPVNVDLIYTQGDENSMANLLRKEHQADEMFTALVKEMNNSLEINNITDFTERTEIPQWA
jgi:SNF2 family DNA or RNA helicase